MILKVQTKKRKKRGVPCNVSTFEGTCKAEELLVVHKLSFGLKSQVTVIKTVVIA